MTHHPNTPAPIQALRALLDASMVALTDVTTATPESVAIWNNAGEAIDALASRTEQAAPSVASGVEKDGAALSQACDLLSMSIGVLMGAKQKIGYVDRSPIARLIAEAVEFLRPWPEHMPSAAPSAAIAAREQPTDAQRAAMVKAAGGDVTEDGATATVEHGDFSFHLDADALRKLLASRQEAPAIAARGQEATPSDFATWLIGSYRGHTINDATMTRAFAEYTDECAASRQEASEQCRTCGASEPFTGSCGTSDSDTRALCKRASRQEAPAASAQDLAEAKALADSEGSRAVKYLRVIRKVRAVADEWPEVDQPGSPLSRIRTIIAFAGSAPSETPSPATVAQPVVMKYSSQRTHHRSGAPMPDVVYEAAQPCPSQGCDRTEALQAAHRLGFLRAAGWMQQDHLFADVSTPAYRKDRDHDIAALSGLEHVGKESGE